MMNRLKPYKRLYKYWSPIRKSRVRRTKRAYNAGRKRDDGSIAHVILTLLLFLVPSLAFRCLVFFDDDAALRNSEIHLLKEIASHTHLFHKLISFQPVPKIAEEDANEEDEKEKTETDEKKVEPFPPLTPTNVILTLLQSILLAAEDGQRERKENYLLWSEKSMKRNCGRST